MTTNLLPDQLERLNEISRQVRGPAAFDDPEVARALSLGRPQRDVVRRAQADFRKAQRELNRRGGPWGPWEGSSDADTRARRLREDAVLQVLSQFSPTQIHAWGAMTGEPFAGKLSTPRPPRPMSDRRPGPFGFDRSPGGGHPNASGG